MKVGQLLNALVHVAEKGANIARIIRSEQSLLELLVQEKKGDQKNKRFVQDFKTLADVLVQEVVRYDLQQMFPGFGTSIYGEESNKFTNTLGDSVTVEIQDTPEKTVKLLSEVLDDNETAAQILARVIHQDVITQEAKFSEQLDIDLAGENLGVWIDPIDSTAQYINGEVGTETNGLVTEGLQCVCVLIGVYEKSTGLPVIGVINQPFHSIDSGGNWTGNTIWGVCVNDLSLSSLSINTSTSTTPDGETPGRLETQDRLVALISSSEKQSVQDILSTEFTLRHVSGAGYKLLGICEDKAETYVLTKSSNYKWDSCGPHAILRALGGGIIKYQDLHQYSKTGQQDYSSLPQITYHKPDNNDLPGALKWSNQGGVVAYRHTGMLGKIAQVTSKMED